MTRARLLYLTLIRPDPRTGGGRHAHANLRALLASDRVDVDYVGPAVDLGAWGLGGARLNALVARDFNARDKLAGLAVGGATGLRGLLLEAMARRHFDAAFIESTMCGFAFGDLPATARTICCVHNVEGDFQRVNGRGVRGALLTRLAARSERQTVEGAHLLMPLHARDAAGLAARYGPPRGDVLLHPACAPPPAPPLAPPPSERPRQVLFLGSLDYSYNHDAIMGFLDQGVAALTAIGHHLVIAGWRPRPALRARAGELAGVTLREGVTDPAPLLRDARAMILPDASGTGMKLRVAEALAAGLPVVGTEAGLAGYEAAYERGVVPVPTPRAISVALGALLGDAERLDQMAVAARLVWAEHFGVAAFDARVERALDLVLGAGAP